MINAGAYFGHTIRRLPTFTQYTTHPTRCTYQVSHKYLPQYSKAYVYLDDCEHNELGALLDRHLKDHLPIQKQARDKLKSVSTDLAKLIGPVSPISKEAFISGYKGPKRRVYERALDNLKIAPIPDARVKTFIKKERHLAEKYKAARLIQARSPEFNICLGQYLKPIEHRVYNLKGDGRRFPKGPLCAKGMNVITKAKTICDILQEFNDPMILGIDHSAFDSRVQKKHLQNEHKVYLRVHGAKTRRNVQGVAELNALLRKQLRNKCKTRRGIIYVTEASRMSGDLNTALGNCVINIEIIQAVCEDKIIGKFYYIVDGDDSVVICESINAGRVTPNDFLPYGMETKIDEKLHARYTDVEFCQAKIIKTINGPLFVGNPIKKISVLGDHYKLTLPEEDYLHCLGIMEYKINAGVPVLQEYALKLMTDNKITKQSSLRKLEDGIDQQDNVWYRYNALKGITVRHEITEQARLDFESAFSISPIEQLEMERLIRSGSRGPLDKTCALRKEIFPTKAGFYKFDRIERCQDARTLM